MEKENIKKFEPGNVYQAKFIIKSNLILKVKILSRTEKTVKYLIMGYPAHMKPVRISRPFIHQGRECLYPLGKYSCAPIVRA